MRRNRLLICLLCICICLSGYGQDTALQRILSTPNDTCKVKTLINHGRTLLDIDNAAALPVFEKIISISKELKFEKGMGQGRMGIAYINAQKGAYREAIENYKAAASNLTKAKLLNRATECMNVVATIYDFLGKRDSAIAIYMQSADMLENTEYTSALGSTYCYIGVLYHNANEYAKAVFYKTKAVDLLRQAKDTVYLIEALTELGDSYAKLKQVEKGMPLAYEALMLANYLNQDNTSGSILATAYYTLAVLHLENKNLDSATYEAKLCVTHAEASGDINTYASGVMVLSDCYQQSGEKEERYAVLMKALETCKKVGNVVLLHDAYLRLADAAFQLGKYSDAYQFHKDFVVYKDSLFNQKSESLLNELEVKYQTAQKEKTIVQKNLEVSQKEVQLQKSRQMTMYSVGSTLVALLVASLVFFHFRNKRKLDQRHLQSMQQEKEIQLLQAVMQGEEKERSRIAKDLHDGVAGMLAAVKMHFTSIALHLNQILQTEGYQQGIRLLDEASQEVRKTSHNLMPEILLQHGLDEAIRRFCNNVTNSSKLTVQYDSIGDIGRFVDSFELSVYRIVQELLNNIIKHSKASEAIVQITFQSDLLSITIEDNGIGLVKGAEQKDGIGLRSLQKRVKAMNGKIEFESASGQGLNAYLEFETVGLEKKEEIAIDNF
ncbi:MAG: sensor histidine kinase [Chitinophagaceae bacterium]|nr:MAG: sensor histidine kinase [Chitinophagaceae bacterium]